MSGVAGLIERLEKATGPDAELDEAVARATNWTPRGVYNDLWIGRENKPLHWFSRAFGMPAYTASIDAALALVERCLPIGEGEGKWHWYVDDRTAAVWPDGNYDESAVSGATPPLAILLALLRALEARQ